MFLNCLLNHPSIGLPRAERVISDNYENSNAHKQVSRLGGEEQITNRTEKLYTLNSIHLSCGLDKKDLPVKEQVSILRTLDELKEYMGMEYELPAAFKVDKQTDYEQEAQAEEDLANFLAGVDFDDNNVAVDP
jgi:hypothetical protein